PGGGEAVVREQHDARVRLATVDLDHQIAQPFRAGVGVRDDLDLPQVDTRLAGHVGRRDAADAEGHGRRRVRVHDAVDVGTGGEHASVPAVLLRGFEVEAANLVAGQVHLDHVLDRRVAERHPGGGAQIAIRVGYAHADVAARTGGEPALAGPVADVDEEFFRIERVHAVVTIGDRMRFSTAHAAWPSCGSFEWSLLILTAGFSLRRVAGRVKAGHVANAVALLEKLVPAERCSAQRGGFPGLSPRIAGDSRRLTFGDITAAAVFTGGSSRFSRGHATIVARPRSLAEVYARRSMR